MLGGGTGIVLQPGQREVDAQAIEKGQRPVFFRIHDPQTVGQLIANMGQVRGREPTAKIGRDRAIERQSFCPIEHIGIGNLLLRQADLERDVEILLEQGQLLNQIVAEQGGLGDGRRIDARR